MRLADALVRLGRLSPEQAGLLGKTVTNAAAAGLALSRSWVSGAQLAEAWAMAWPAPFLQELSPDLLDPALVRNLPVEWARARRLLPVRWNGAVAALTCDPSDLGAQEDLSRLLATDLTVVMAPPEVLQQAIDRCYVQRSDSAKDALAGLHSAGAGQGAAAPPAAGPEDLLHASGDAPVSRFVNALLMDAVRARASDVHIEPGDAGVRIRLRIDGLLYDRDPAPKSVEAALISRLKVMGRLDIAERRLPQDGMARVRIGPREMDIRISTVPIAAGERVVLRILNHETALVPLGQLGLSDAMTARFRQWMQTTQGVILVTGPTGSGKTTTLYAALGELDTRRLNVITIEDPIEYQLPTVSQIQVNTKIDLTFARSLRHVLRQDPDVILVGETRDLETAEIAIRASLTGHLVFTTLHTNDAASAAIRLADIGVEPYLLSSSLRGVIAQRLVRRLCPACREMSVITAADVEGWGARGRTWIGHPHGRARGCPECLEGYRGRIGLFEMLEVNGRIAELIRRNASAADVQAAARDAGFGSLLDDGLRRVESGETSLSELIRVVGVAG